MSSDLSLLCFPPPFQLTVDSGRALLAAGPSSLFRGHGWGRWHFRFLSGLWHRFTSRYAFIWNQKQYFIYNVWICLDSASNRRVDGVVDESRPIFLIRLYVFPLTPFISQVLFLPVCGASNILSNCRLIRESFKIRIPTIALRNQIFHCAYTQVTGMLVSLAKLHFSSSCRWSTPLRVATTVSGPLNWLGLTKYLSLVGNMYPNWFSIRQFTRNTLLHHVDASVGRLGRHE